MTSKALAQLNNAELSAFCSQMALMLQSGLPVSDGLHLMLEGACSDERAVIASLVENIDKGACLADSFADAKVFPGYMTHMVEIGETSGRLEEVFAALAKHYEREADLRNSIKSALTYPMIMILMVFIISGVIVAKVMPIFAQVFNQLGTDLSGMGRALLGIGTIIGRYSVVIIGILLVLVASAVLIYRKDSGQTLISKLGRFRTIRKITECAEACRFADGMALTLSSGLSPERSLELTLPLITEDDTKARLSSCIEQVKSGDDIYKAMVDNKLISGLNARLAAIGHRTGRMDQCMEEIGRLCQKELDESISGILAALEPALIIIISVIVGAILLSVMLPLIGIMSVI